MTIAEEEQIMTQVNTGKRSPVLLMALTVFIDFTGFGLVIPLLPFWALHLGANDFEVGLILTLFALAQFIFTPFLGALSDRLGRRPIIIWSLVIEAISFIFTALATSLPFLYAARIIGGLGSSNIGSAQAVVADTTNEQDRAKGMGFIGAAIGLGFVVGPALSGIFSGFNSSLPLWIATGMALINALLVMLYLPETRVAGKMAQRENTLLLVFTGWKSIIKQSSIIRIIGVYFLFMLAFTAMEATFPLLTLKEFGWGQKENGYIFAYVGILIVIMQGGLVAQLVKRIGAQNLMVAGLVIMATGLIILGFSTNLGVLIIGLGALSIGNGAVTPTSSTLLSLLAPKDNRGEILGISQGVGSLGRIIGPTIATILFQGIGAPVPFVIGGAITLIAAMIAFPTFPNILGVAHESEVSSAVH
jgi:MFS family permease